MRHPLNWHWDQAEGVLGPTRGQGEVNAVAATFSCGHRVWVTCDYKEMNTIQTRALELRCPACTAQED